ncbi:MAG: ABC transporter substrate-binding protein [Pseudanabaenaceae cyanobacterium]
MSLLPSATEIVHALSMTKYLVGRSHECDFPEQVQDLPVCTAPRFLPVDSSQEIHDRVTEIVQRALSVYEVEIEVLQELQPTHIITQAQCEVCAVSLADVEQAVGRLTNSYPQIISLQPNFLYEVWQDIERVGAMLNIDYRSVVNGLKERVEACRAISQKVEHHPTVACIEWIAPLMSAGNWLPEMVELAGGKNLFGIAGKHSPWLQWEELVSRDPEVIIFMPCGFDLEKTAIETNLALQDKKWLSLQAYQQQQLYITDGNSYFNRPGPRLVESLEILQEILHPELVHYGYEGTAWQRLIL